MPCRTYGVDGNKHVRIPQTFRYTPVRAFLVLQNLKLLIYSKGIVSFIVEVTQIQKQFAYYKKPVQFQEFCTRATFLKIKAWKHFSNVETLTTRP